METPSEFEITKRKDSPATTWTDGLAVETLANLAHELRTPVQVLLGLIDILRDDYSDQLDQGGREVVERMNTNAFDLSQTLSNLMAFIIAKAGKDAAVDENFTPAGLMADIQPALDAANDRKHLQLNYDVAGAPPIIKAPRKAVSAIIVNLALNAIKFTPNGSVAVRIGQAKGERGDVIEIEVSDSGPGLDPRLLAQVSQPFAQLSQSSKRSHRGVGLGLAIVRHHVSTLGGTLHLNSTEGQGATFTVHFPVRDERVTVLRPPRLVVARRTPIQPLPTATRSGVTLSHRGW